MGRVSLVPWSCRVLLAFLVTTCASVVPSVARVTLDLLLNDARQLPARQTRVFEHAWGFAQVFGAGLRSPWLWLSCLVWASCCVAALAAVTRGTEVSERILKRTKAVLDDIQTTYDAHVASHEYKQAKKRARSDPSKLTATQTACIEASDRLLTELKAAERDAVKAEAAHSRNITEAKQAEAPVAIITGCNTGSGIRRLQFHDTNWNKEGKENKSALRQHQRAEAHYFSYQKAAVKLSGSNEVTEASHEAMRAKFEERSVDAKTIAELGEVLDIIDAGASMTVAVVMLVGSRSSAIFRVYVAPCVLQRLSVSALVQ